MSVILFRDDVFKEGMDDMFPRKIEDQKEDWEIQRTCFWWAGTVLPANQMQRLNNLCLNNMDFYMEVSM